MQVKRPMKVKGPIIAHTRKGEVAHRGKGAMGIDHGGRGGQVPQNLKRGDCPPPQILSC